MTTLAQLRAGFLAPPAAARPRVWWHWMNGAATREGVEADLAWMVRTGIGGVHQFDGSFRPPKSAALSSPYLGPAWREAFRIAVSIAAREGLEFGIAGSPGWSETGGPWVTPEQAMKKLVWSTTVVTADSASPLRLRPLPSLAGPIQNLPGGEGGAGLAGVDVKRPAPWVRDAMVVAYPLQTATPVLNDLAAITCSGGDASRAVSLASDDLGSVFHLPLAGDPPTGWIEFGFECARTVRALTFCEGGPPSDPRGRWTFRARLEAGEDETAWRPVAEIAPERLPQQTVAFAPVTARRFRVSIEAAPPRMSLGQPLPPAPASAAIAALVLHGEARVHRFEDKAGFSAEPGLSGHPTPVEADETAIPMAGVVDLTARLDEDGQLAWTPPSGTWVILRLGYSLTGRTNHPAPPEGTGLEVDKLSAEHVRAYAETYLGLYADVLGPELIGPAGLSCMVLDSYEAGAQNWTDDLPRLFAERRGYELQSWLPVLTGRVVEGAAASDAFLWDFRQTLGELMAEHHYGVVSEVLRERGLKRYGESHEVRRAFVGDGMSVKKSADIPMGALWIGRHDLPPAVHDIDIRESASVAHIYGQNLVAAEAFTTYAAPYAHTPWSLKPTADRLLALGLNRFVIHTSAHQPDAAVGPGVGLGPFGQWFTRKETWAPFAHAWVDYLARGSFLMQQGRHVADIAYFYPEDANLTSHFPAALPDIPPGYDFDFVSADALVNALRAAGSKLRAPGGAEYEVLVLDPAVASGLSVPVLRQLHRFASQGVRIVGPRPTKTPSQADDPGEFRALVDDLWGPGTIEAGSAAAALARAKIQPDLQLAEPCEHLMFAHRHSDDWDIYLVSNQSDAPLTAECRFRARGPVAELWRADDGAAEQLSCAERADGTRAVLSLGPREAVFVLLGQAGSGAAVAEAREPEALVTIEAPWEVTFDTAHGGPPGSIQFAALAGWQTHANPDIRHYSGIAAYSATIRIEPEWLAGGGDVWLDLGDVFEVAEVFLDGISHGVAWKPPYRVRLRGVSPGAHRLEIRVANLWPNRLIGDKASKGPNVASALYNPFTAASPLLHSGLVGPVRLLRA